MISKPLCAVLLSMLCSRAIAADFCSYSNTNRLVWDKDFPSRIHQFLGGRRENFFYNGPLYEQVLAGLGGPPDDIIDIGEKLRFASACRAHSCDEKAEVVMACPDKVLAIGILHFDVNTTKATLTIYAHIASPAIRSSFHAWQRKIAASYDIESATEYREAAPSKR